jgi:hypothetical protein
VSARDDFREAVLLEVGDEYLAAILAAADAYRADGLLEFAAELDKSGAAMLVASASLADKMRTPSIAEVYHSAAKAARRRAEGKP